MKTFALNNGMISMAAIVDLRRARVSLTSRLARISHSNHLGVGR